MLLYRAHRDIHCQRPPDAFSVSLNIVATSSRSGWCDQYRFGLGEKRVDGLLTAMPSAVLMRLALASGNANGHDLVRDFADKHPSDHVRFDAIAAQAAAVTDLDGKRAILERGAADRSAQLSGLCRDRLRRLDPVFRTGSDN